MNEKIGSTMSSGRSCSAWPTETRSRHMRSQAIGGAGWGHMVCWHTTVKAAATWPKKACTV